jgi:hypothetical protein
VLSHNPDLKEILWNFSRLRDRKSRLTLKQNPCFYSWLPTSPEAYGGKFCIDPIENFQLEKIRVLTDNPGPTGRVYLETAQNTRAFGNVWVPKTAIIFKGPRSSVILFTLLISFQTSVESSRVKASSERLLRTRPTCCTSRSLRNLLLLNRRFPQIRTTHHLS